MKTWKEDGFFQRLPHGRSFLRKAVVSLHKQ